MSAPSGGLPPEAQARLAQVNAAWDIIVPAVTEQSGADLSPAALLLMQVAASGDNLDSMGANLDLAHWRFFTSFASGEWPTTDDMDGVQANLANFTEEITGPEFDATRLRHGAATMLRVAVTSMLINRIGDTDYVAYPCPPGMRNPKYTDAAGEYTYRHLHVRTPDGTVPLRVIDMLSTRWQVRDEDPVEVLALGNLVKVYGGQASEDLHTSRQRRADVLGYTASLLVAEARGHADPEDPDLDVVDDISDEVFARLDASRYKFDGVF
jgi:hypothetical protein